MELLQGAGWFAKLTLAVDVVPLVMAVVFILRPTDRHLALMRPLSLAGLFAALTGGVVGLLNTLRSLGMTDQWSPETYRRLAMGASESLVPVFVGFGCLTAAWLLVAAGMGREGK